MRIHTANRKQHPHMTYGADRDRRMGRRAERYRKRRADMALASLRPGLIMLADFMTEFCAMFQSPEWTAALEAIHVAGQEFLAAARAQGLLPEEDGPREGYERLYTS